MRNIVVIVADGSPSTIMSAKNTTVTQVTLEQVRNADRAFYLSAYDPYKTLDAVQRKLELIYSLNPTIVLVPNWIGEDDIHLCFEWAMALYEKAGKDEADCLINYYPKQ